MPGSLVHSPADILRYLLIAKGVGVTPVANPSNTAWPIYAHNEPDGPDNCITVFDVQGKKSGRTMVDGEVQEHHGFQVRIRSSLSTDGYTKARSIAIVMDEQVYQEPISVSSSHYCVHSITRTSDVIPLGKEATTPSKRSICVINGIIMLRTKNC
jgi:hypothetical protein